MGVGNFASCCSCQKIPNMKGEEFLRLIFKDIEISRISEMTFLKSLKEIATDDHIKINDFLNMMEKYWSKTETNRNIQINLFQKYFNATTGLSKRKEINIYEISLLMIPLYKQSLEEKQKTFEFTIKTLCQSQNKFNLLNIREFINLYYNFYTIFITKILYYEFKSNSNLMESDDLKNLLVSVFNEENVIVEVNLLFKKYEKDVLSSQELNSICSKISFTIDDFRDYFITKYSLI